MRENLNPNQKESLKKIAELKKNNPELIDETLKKVKSMNIEGPTMKEYMDFVNKNKNSGNNDDKK